MLCAEKYRELLDSLLCGGCFIYSLSVRTVEKDIGTKIFGYEFLQSLRQKFGNSL